MQRELKRVAEAMLLSKPTQAASHDMKVDWNMAVMFLSQELCEQNFPGAEEVLEFEQACGGLF